MNPAFWQCSSLPSFFRISYYNNSHLQCLGFVCKKIDEPAKRYWATAKCSKAANNTKDLIGISIQEIERGTELAANVVASMQEVLDAIENVNGMIGKSAENNQTQNQNIEQIKLGIEEISKAVEDNSASAEETSATSEELAAQAATLEALVKHFDLEDDGSNDATR